MQWTATDIRQQKFKDEFAKWIERFPEEDVPVIYDPLLASWHGRLTASGWYCGGEAFSATALVFDVNDQFGLTYRSFELDRLAEGEIDNIPF